MFNFFDNNEFFIQYQWTFGRDVLKPLFKEQYVKKYSMVGDGIYELIIIDNKIYHIDIKQTKAMMINDNKKAFRDSVKDIIVEKICKKLKEKNINYSVNSGKFITFKYNNFIFKVEIIKKAVMPE